MTDKKLSPGQLRAQQQIRRKRYRRIALILATLVVITGAIGVGSTLLNSSADDGTGTSAATSDDGGLEFAVETLDGGTFRLSDFRGQTVAIFAMAGWCGTCIPEAQAWAEVYPEYQARGVELLVLSVDPSDTKAQMRNFQSWAEVEDLLPYWAIDTDGSISQLLEVRTLDQTMIIDPDGQLVFTDYGVTLADQLRNALDEAL